MFEIFSYIFLKLLEMISTILENAKFDKSFNSKNFSKTIKTGT